MITIDVNQQLVTVEDGSSLEFLINHLLSVNTTGIAIAVNGTVIPRAQWGSTILSQNDKILIIKATRGG